MAHLRCEFYSETLGLSSSMTVLLPQHVGEGDPPVKGPPPVLYLLHGLTDDDTSWVRRTSLERYVAPLGLAVVMPAAHRSFYTDEALGQRYWTFLSEELPEVVSRFFNVATSRDSTFVAGLSMGGYGAMKWALREPQRFAAAACLSGVLDLTGVDLARPPDPHMRRRVFAEREPVGGHDDPLWLLDQRDVGELPALYVGCGTEDPLIDRNRTFVERCSELGVPVTVRFRPGAHEWAYWDTAIQDVLAWLPRPG